MNLNKQYASAIIALGAETKTTDEIYKSTEFVIEAMKNVDLKKALSSFSITKEQKIEIVDAVFKSLDDITIKSIKVMCEKHQAKYIAGVFSRVRKQINIINGVEDGICYSSVALKKPDLKIIETKISKILDKKVELMNLVDKSLISGIKVEVADKVYDYSAKSSLERIKEKLLKEVD